MTSLFKPAKRRRTALKIAIMGAAGTGKTYTASKIAQLLGDKTAVVDTEGAFHLYADIFPFDVYESPDASIKTILTAHEEARKSNYQTLILDNLSDNWQAVLAFVETQKAKSKNQYGAWNTANAQYESMIEEIKASPIHIIGTVRASIANHVGDVNPDLEAFGLKPEIRTGAKGVLYEFHIVLAMLQSNRALVVKSRCTAIRNGTHITFEPKAQPGEITFDYFMTTITTWANAGEAVTVAPTTFTASHYTQLEDELILGGSSADGQKAFLGGVSPTDSTPSPSAEWQPLPTPVTYTATPTRSNRTVNGATLPFYRVD